MKTRPRPRTFVTLIAWAPVVLVTGIAALWLVFVASWKGRQIDQLEQATDRFVLRVTTWEERGVVLLLPGSFRNIDVKAVGGHWVTLIEDRHDNNWRPDLADLEFKASGPCASFRYRGQSWLTLDFGQTWTKSATTCG
jgi:hypothetical protein